MHHLGDENLDGWGLFSLVPDAEDVFWTSGEFDLPSLEEGPAYLIIDLVQVEGSVATGAWVNSVYVGDLPQCLSPDQWAIDQSIAIGGGVLLPTGNIISIQSGSDGVNYDDFMFQNVRIDYVPEPATLGLLCLGGLALLRRKS